MRHRWARYVRLLCCTLTLAVCSVSCARGVDIVLRGGGVYTVDADRSWAEAVAVDDGRIVYVGANAGVEALVGSRTEVVDLNGKMVLPGLQDSHVHPPLGMILERLCRLEDATTKEEILEAAADCAAQESQGWVLGFGWRSSIFLPLIAPDKHDLDRIVPNRPVALIAKDMHTFWLNSAALEAVGITRDTPTPEGGEIVRDPTSGEPSGALRDMATSAVVAAIPKPGPLASLRAMRATISKMNSYGYTSLMDARVDDRNTAWAYRLLELVGKLDMRVSLAILLDPRGDSDQLEEIRKTAAAFSSDRIDTRIVKIFVDGGTAVRSAASSDYAGGLPSYEPYIDEVALARYVVDIDHAGLAVHLHTLGDRATHIALNAIEAARRANPDGHARHAITHLVYPDPADLGRFRELNVIANISPYWAFPNEWSASFPPTIGADKAASMYPFRDLVDAGARLAAGSDYPFTPLNPFLAIEVGITRRDPERRNSDPMVEDQALTLENLIAAYTIGAAYQLHQEEITGSIEVGKAADLVILDRDLFAIPPEDLSETSVVMTLIDGEVVYRQPTSE